MIISSRTPEGEQNRCPVCATEIWLDPSRPAGDAPCPNCGHLVWYSDPPITVVTFTDGEMLDESAWDQLMHLGSECHPPRLMLNVESISLPSSTVMARLVLLNNDIRARGGKLVLVNVGPNLNEVFKIMGVGAHLEICADENAAINALIDDSSS
jgi:anti-anti-sigma regulatory factor